MTKIEKKLFVKELDILVFEQATGHTDEDAGYSEMILKLEYDKMWTMAMTMDFQPLAGYLKNTRHYLQVQGLEESFVQNRILDKYSQTLLELMPSCATDFIPVPNSIYKAMFPKLFKEQAKHQQRQSILSIEDDIVLTLHNNNTIRRPLSYYKQHYACLQCYPICYLVDKKIVLAQKVINDGRDEKEIVKQLSLHSQHLFAEVIHNANSTHSLHNQN